MLCFWQTVGTLGHTDIDDKELTGAFFLRAQAVREIAGGLFDTTEREIVFKFVAECEALKLENPPKTG
jgi:hypothetical protein